MLDFSQVENFERRLRTHFDPVEDEWKTGQARELAATMRPPVRSGRLLASISPRNDGVAIGADYWKFVEYGTVHMGPQPFVRPAVRARTQPAVRDAGDQIIRRLT